MFDLKDIQWLFSQNQQWQNHQSKHGITHPPAFSYQCLDLGR